MGIEFGTSGYLPPAERPMPPSLIPSMEASSKGRSRQEKRARARRFHEEHKPTPPAAQPDQPAQLKYPGHWLDHGGPFRRSQRRAKRLH